MITALWFVVLAEVATVTVLLVALLAATVVRSRGHRRRAAIESRWYDARRRGAGAGPGGTSGAAAGSGEGLGGLSPRRRAAAMDTLVGSLSGDLVATVLGPEDVPGLRAQAEAWTRSRRWWRRLHGVRILVQLDEPPQAHRAMLTDRRPEVRAEVAGWVARDPRPDDVDRLVAMLDRDVKGCRFAAENALRSIGAAAVPALTAYLGGPAERAAVALGIAAAAGSPALLPVAGRWSRDADPANRAASAAVLAAVGTDQAGRLLVGLLEDADPLVRAAAATGLGEMALWAAAPQLVQQLRDPDWSARRAAAAALRGLGPVGRLCLRRALDDPDPRAAEIARHVLDLPDSALALEAG